MISIWLKLCVYMCVYQNVISAFLWVVDIFQMSFNFFYAYDLDYVSFLPL